MKKLTIKSVQYESEIEDNEFIEIFQIQILLTLRKRGYLTENELEKGLSLLKERRL